MKLFVLLFGLFLIFGCGREEDPHYVPCDDSSGSQKCKKIDQSELAKYINTDREYAYLGTGVKSNSRSRDKNTIQSFIINTRYPQARYNSRKQLAIKYDDQLSCNFRSYYGILNEEGTRRSYDVKIIGVFDNSAYRCGSYEFGDPRNQRESLIYNEF